MAKSKTIKKKLATKKPVKKKETKTIILAAGGTGGHIFPAEALADQLKTQGYSPILITDERFEKYAGALKNHPFHILRMDGKARGIIKKATRMVALLMAFKKARALLLKLKPQAVVGFGGYPSLPTALAAHGLKIPVILHEQNSVLGRANRLLAKKASAVAISFPELKGVNRIFTGNPVRPAIAEIHKKPYKVSKESLNLLVTGGSQGASIFSRVVPEAVALLPEKLQARLVIAQQSRLSDVEETKKRYTATKAKIELAPFFENMAERIETSQLMIIRAGASSLSEALVAGRPCIIVPYPQAMDDHQTKNALSADRAGAGWMIKQTELTPKILAAHLQKCLENPSILQDAAAKAKAMSHPDAAQKLANIVIEAIDE